MDGFVASAGGDAGRRSAAACAGGGIMTSGAGLAKMLAFHLASLCLAGSIEILRK